MLKKLLLIVGLATNCGASEEPVAIWVDEVGRPTEDRSTEPGLRFPVESIRVAGDRTAHVLSPPAPRCLAESASCYPILLAHGIMANPKFLQFFGVADHLRSLGYIVAEGAVEPLDTVEVRGAMLAEQIEALAVAHGVDKVNVVAHSMGGLDARYAISSLGKGHRVATLTTISTPHRGSAVADTFLAEEAVGGDSEVMQGVLMALGSQYGEGLAEDPDLAAALGSLAEASAPAFNAANTDDPRVEYESWAGVSTMWGLGRSEDEVACGRTFWSDNGENDHLDAIFFATAPLAGHGGERRPNDGMVTVESARWGNFRGCLRADHADEIGQFEDTGPNADTAFDYLAFYEFLAHDIAARGF